MSSKRGEVIEGFNAFIDEQKKLDGQVFLSLTYFNEHINTAFHRQPLERFNRLDGSNYVTAGGTALLDAVGTAIGSGWIQSDRVIMVIQTDGEENSSRTFDLQRIKALIEQKQADGWTFIFLGSNIDSFAQAASMGINVATVANYDDKVFGQTRTAYMSASASVGALRSGASGQRVTSTLRNGLLGNDNAPDSK